ncbi:MAG: carbohydrate-binding domain-containing protein, partial [Alistipes sp.]|nr:carbohydrate-binding domain-containing protein [Alistipes sp.]
MIRIEMVAKMCATLFMALCIVACSPEIKFIPNDNDTEQVPDKPDTPDESETPDTPEEPDVPIPQPSEGYPMPDTSIEAWSGAYADDGANDIVGDNVDFFHELNSFTNLVVVKYDGATAEVTTTNSDIAIHQDGAYVTVDMQSKGVANTEVVIVGRSSDGALKIYSDSKYKLSLYGVDLCSQRGPAINSQSKKRVFLNIYPETTNRLSDCATYSEDSYTMPGVFNDDRKGALFAEGNIIVSGHGALVV